MLPTYVGAHLAAATMANPQSDQRRQCSLQAGRLLSASEESGPSGAPGPWLPRSRSGSGLLIQVGFRFGYHL